MKSAWRLLYSNECPVSSTTVAKSPPEMPAKFPANAQCDQPGLQRTRSLSLPSASILNQMPTISCETTAKPAPIAILLVLPPLPICLSLSSHRKRQHRIGARSGFNLGHPAARGRNEPRCSLLRRRLGLKYYYYSAGVLIRGHKS